MCWVFKYLIILSVVPWYRHLPAASMYNWSNIWSKVALGWWMVQMMVRPWWANCLRSEIHWEHEELSNPLKSILEKKIILRFIRRIKNFFFLIGPAERENLFYVPTCMVFFILYYGSTGWYPSYFWDSIKRLAKR